jgi:hypothetical protein
MKILKLILFSLFTFTVFCLSFNTTDVIVKDIKQEESSSCNYSNVKKSDLFFTLSRVSRTNFCNSNINSYKKNNNYIKITILEVTSNKFYLQFFNQNNYYIKNCLINFRKSDLIFPFHYYW